MYYHETTKSGVNILAEEISHVRSVALGIWVDVGSRYETDENRGISHFIEHMMFKGTTRRTAKQIAEELDAVGGQLNAFTTKEYTCYFARVLDEHFDLALDLLTDMIFNSRFETEDVEKERNVIVEEIRMYEDTPDELVHDIFSSTLWQGHTLGCPIIGTEEIVRGFNRSTLLEYYREYYQPGRMVVAAAGNLNHAEVTEKIKERFQQPGHKYERGLLVPVPRNGKTCRIKDTEQVHLCVGVPGLSLNDERIYAMQLLNTILGGGISSRLFQEIRERRGLVYSVYSYHSSYHDTGIFNIYAGLNKGNVPLVLDLICHAIEDIRQGNITVEEITRTKEQLKGNLYLSLESVNTHMNRLGKSQLYQGRVLAPEELVALVQKVSKENIVDLAREVFVPGAFALASVGPWEDSGEFAGALSCIDG